MFRNYVSFRSFFFIWNWVVLVYFPLNEKLLIVISGLKSSFIFFFTFY